MKPDFALNLSHTGISILHRGKDGWHQVGEVMLDEAEFTDKLAYMRQTAALLESGNITTKLVIPNSQILYTKVDAPGPTQAERHGQIRAALEGATPYGVDELAYDWCEVEGKVHVAAVARETLKEAEDFAAEHGFNPLSFVAIPEVGKFEGEPYFGATVASEIILEGADTVERDDEAILLPGMATDVDETPAKAGPDKAGEDASQPDDTVAKAESDAPQGDISEVDDEPGTKVAKKADVGGTEKSLPIEVSGGDGAQPDTGGKEARTKTPGQDRSAPIKAVKQPGKPDRNVTTPTTEATGTVKADKSTKAGAPKKKAEKKPKKNKSEAKKTPSPPLSFASRRGRKGKNTGKSGRKEPRLALTPEITKPATAKSAGLPGKPVPSALVAPLSPDSIASGVVPAISTHLPAHTEEEEQALTVFGARKQTITGGKPNYLGAALFSALVVLMGGVALWSALGRDRQSALLDPAVDTDVTVSVVEPDSGSQEPTVSEALAMLVEPIRRQGEVPVAVEPEIAVTTPVAEAGVDAAPLPDTDPDIVLATPEDTPDVSMVPTPAIAPDGDIATLPASGDDLHLDAEIQPEPEPEQPRAPDGEAARAAYAKTGVWQLAPPPPGLPGMDELDTLYIASIDPVIASQDAVALPELPKSSSGFTLPRQNSPLPSDTRFELDARGFVIPTAEGALTPDGILVFAGAPPVRPELRGNRVPQVLQIPDLGQSDLRPPARPADLVARNEAAQFGGLSRGELGAIRPRPRPKTSKALDEANEAPTALAVAHSRLPRHRPQNFARMVAQVRARMATEETAVAAAAVPQRQILTPSNPSNASVARLATVKNAINLRRVSLIGVYGTASKRRALVRLPSGRYVKVQVGERMHGGKVAAIGESELRYVKGGRTIVLRMPKS